MKKKDLYKGLYVTYGRGKKLSYLPGLRRESEATRECDGKKGIKEASGGETTLGEQKSA